MNNKTNLIVSGTSFISIKLKEQGFLRKYHQKHTGTLWIRDPEKIHPGSRGQKNHRIRIRNTGSVLDYSLFPRGPVDPR
jgi:hypothetical protein